MGKENMKDIILLKITVFTLSKKKIFITDILSIEVIKETNLLVITDKNACVTVFPLHNVDHYLFEKAD